MRKTFIALSVFTSLTFGQEAPKQPSPADLLPIAEAVRDYYRAAGQVATAVAQRDDAKARAQALQAALEARFGCRLNLDTLVCTAQAQPAKEQK